MAPPARGGHQPRENLPESPEQPTTPPASGGRARPRRTALSHLNSSVDEAAATPATTSAAVAAAWAEKRLAAAADDGFAPAPPAAAESPRRMSRARGRSKLAGDTTADESDASYTSSLTPRRRSARLSERASRDVSRESSAAPPDRSQPTLPPTSEETEVEEDEKEDLPAFDFDRGGDNLSGLAATPFARPPIWSTGFRRVLDAVSPSNLFRRKPSSSSVHSDDTFNGDGKDREDEGSDDEIITTVELVYDEDGDGDGGDDDDADLIEHQPSKTRWAFSRLYEGNRLAELSVPLLKGLYHAIKILLTAVYFAFDRLVMYPMERIGSGVKYLSQRVSLPLLLGLSFLVSCATAAFLYESQTANALATTAGYISGAWNATIVPVMALGWSFANVSYIVPSFSIPPISIEGYMPSFNFSGLGRVSESTDVHHDENNMEPTASWFTIPYPRWPTFWWSRDEVEEFQNFVDSELPPLERLDAIEKALLEVQEHISRNSERIKSLSTFQTDGSLELKSVKERVETLSGRISSQQQGLDSVSQQINSLRTEAVVASERAKEDIRKEMSELYDKRGDSEKASRKVKADLDSAVVKIEAKLQEVLGQLNDLEARAKDSDAKFEERVRNLLEGAIPSLMVARINKSTGDVELEPSFLLHLQRMFVTSDKAASLETDLKGRHLDVESGFITSLTTKLGELENAAKTADGKVSAAVAEIHDRLFKSEEKTAADIEQLKNSVDEIPGTFDNFLASSKEYVNDVLSGKVSAPAGTSFLIMSKPEVIDYLEREVGKVASSIDKLKETVKSSGGSVNVESLKPAVDELVQRSLARYSADVIARPDYALSSAGASVVLKLTSPIWSTPSKSLFGRMMNTRVARGLGPYFALTPGTMPGTCWSFAGPSGILGVQLVQDVIPTDFTIDHVPADLVLDSAHGLDSAPKDVEVWAVFDVDGFAEADLDDPKARLPVVGGSTVPGLLLATHRFDPKKASVQTFPAAPEAVRALRARKVVPGVVLLRVKSNWGNEDYTCLYRFRVHAKEA